MSKPMASLPKIGITALPTIPTIGLVLLAVPLAVLRLPLLLA